MRNKFDNLYLNGFSDNEGRVCKKRYVHEIAEALLKQKKTCGKLRLIMSRAYLVGGKIS